MGFFAGLLGALLVFAGWQTYKLTGLQEDKETWAQQLHTAVTSANEQKAAVEQCEANAKANIKAAEERRAASALAAQRAQERNATLEEQLERLNGTIPDVVASIEGGCPAIRDPDYLGFLCSGPTGCTGTDEDSGGAR